MKNIFLTILTLVASVSAAQPLTLTEIIKDHPYQILGVGAGLTWSYIEHGEQPKNCEFEPVSAKSTCQPYPQFSQAGQGMLIMQEGELTAQYAAFQNAELSYQGDAIKHTLQSFNQDGELIKQEVSSYTAQQTHVATIADDKERWELLHPNDEAFLSTQVALFDALRSPQASAIKVRAFDTLEPPYIEIVGETQATCEAAPCTSATELPIPLTDMQFICADGISKCFIDIGNGQIKDKRNKVLAEIAVTWGLYFGHFGYKIEPNDYLTFEHLVQYYPSNQLGSKALVVAIHNKPAKELLFNGVYINEAAKNELFEFFSDVMKK